METYPPPVVLTRKSSAHTEPFAVILPLVPSIDVVTFPKPSQIFKVLVTLSKLNATSPFDNVVIEPLSDKICTVSFSSFLKNKPPA